MSQMKTTARKGTLARRPTASADRPGDVGTGTALRETTSYGAPPEMQTAGMFTNGATLH